jgi:KaiC/GvpD/RAD55 family RecA-like ATPase
VLDAAKAAGIEPSIVVVDTFSQTFSGEENSANEVAAYFREVGNHLRALWHCTVLVIHHSGHSATDRPRGSSSMQANTSFLLGAFRDEKEMLATLTCVHMKDGRAFDDAIFQVNVQQLGTDADGDQVTQLVARHLSSAEEVQDAMAAEHKAGRGGHNQLIVSLAHNGMKEAELRKAFYEDCATDTTDGRRQAYFRARKWAIEKQFFEIAKGIVIVTEPEKRT